LSIRYSPEALSDLAALWAYYAERNEATATKIVKDIRKKLLRLSAMPSLGIARPELGDATRSLSLQPHEYVAFYRTARGRIEIVRILHARRDIATSLLT
jgi:plasmid stabilization system protein ParE